VVYHDPTPTVLSAHLEYLSRVARIVSLPELWNSFGRSPLAVVTIDDGVVGNLKLKDVCQKRGVRPMLYLCTGTIRVGGGFWWQVVDTEEKAEALKKLQNGARREALRQLGFEQDRKKVPREAVSVHELCSMLEWSDLGAHTRFHPILTRCEDRECEEEISQSRHELLSFIGLPLEHFAYPNGDYSDREVRLVKDSGFGSARTCNPGWNRYESDRFRLKAVVIDDNASVSKFAVQLTAIPALIRGLKRRLTEPKESGPSGA
jgi:peptidoglycan/xylan/chitin deacetylase (PgdA/CDA1 family)